MKRPVISSVYCKPVKETLLLRILRQCGAYYHSADLFYQELWHQRLSGIGFRVTSVEKLPYHEIWDIRLYGTLTVQTHLLLTIPVSKPHFCAKDIVLKQLRSQAQRIAKAVGET